MSICYWHRVLILSSVTETKLLASSSSSSSILSWKQLHNTKQAPDKVTRQIINHDNHWTFIWVALVYKRSHLACYVSLDPSSLIPSSSTSTCLLPSRPLVFYHLLVSLSRLLRVSSPLLMFFIHSSSNPQTHLVPCVYVHTADRGKQTPKQWRLPGLY